MGNALDVAEAVEVLQGSFRGRLRDLTVTFAAESLSLLEGVPRDEAVARSERALDGGEALAVFARMVEAQGGDPRVADDPWSVLPRAPVVRPIPAPRDGVVATIEAEEIGRAGVDLGAGRHRKGDPIDPATGIVFRAKVGDAVDAGAELGTVHARGEGQAEAAVRWVAAAVRIQDEPVEAPPLVYGWYGEGAG